MNCYCGNALSTTDALESEKVGTGKTMCAECRASYFEFHEADAPTDELLQFRNIRLLAKAIGEYL